MLFLRDVSKTDDLLVEKRRIKILSWIIIQEKSNYLYLLVSNKESDDTVQFLLVRSFDSVVGFNFATHPGLAFPGKR